MSTVTFDMSMSLDGFVEASGSTPAEPLGKGGQRLHDWTMGTDTTGEQVTAAVPRAGAYICGRRTYDASLPWWGADGPTGSARLPLVVVTHRAPDQVPDGSVYRFVTDGLESALAQATDAAAGKDVWLMGGPDLGRQFIRAGLVDRIGIHLVPVLFGGGKPMFDLIGDDHVELEVVEVTNTPAATHLVYRIVK